MTETEQTTLDRIHNTAKAEFLEKGFINASLRNIAKAAGVTTGALYGYYSNKAALFAALVESHAAAVMGMFMQAMQDFENLPDEEQPAHMGVDSAICLDKIIDYIYKHFDAFKLIICCSDGTAYADFVHEMVEVEVEYTLKYIEVLKRLEKPVPETDKQFIHIVASGMLGGVFEIVIHDMPKEKAKQYVRTLCDFYTAGWLKVMGQ